VHGRFHQGTHSHFMSVLLMALPDLPEQRSRKH
jgi:hypothetical protein